MYVVAMIKNLPVLLESTKIESSKMVRELGYSVLNVLVTDVEPEREVKVAMNKINATKRQRMAAQEEAEAEKIRRVLFTQYFLFFWKVLARNYVSSFILHLLLVLYLVQCVFFLIIFFLIMNLMVVLRTYSNENDLKSSH